MSECDRRTERNIPCDGDRDNPICSGYAKCWPMDKATISSVQLVDKEEKK